MSRLGVVAGDRVKLQEVKKNASVCYWEAFRVMVAVFDFKLSSCVCLCFKL